MEGTGRPSTVGSQRKADSLAPCSSFQPGRLACKTAVSTSGRAAKGKGCAVEDLDGRPRPLAAGFSAAGVSAQRSKRPPVRPACKIIIDDSSPYEFPLKRLLARGKRAWLHQ